jgi:hypothetical protein
VPADGVVVSESFVEFLPYADNFRIGYAQAVGFDLHVNERVKLNGEFIEIAVDDFYGVVHTVDGCVDGVNVIVHHADVVIDSLGGIADCV